MSLRKSDSAKGSVGRVEPGGLRKVLFQTSALGIGVSLAILKAGSAEAQTCTTAPGTVDCPQGTYNSIGSNPTQNTTITIAPGSTVAQVGVSNGNVGGVFSTVDVTVNAPDVNFAAPPFTSFHGLVVNTTNGAPPGGPGNISIVAGNVEARGLNAVGILALGRDISITADSVHTRGTTSPGLAPSAIIAQSNVNGATISVDVGETSTVADGAYGILANGIINGANSPVVDVTVNSGSATTDGINAVGILAQNGSGAVNITSGSVITSGQRSDAVIGFSLNGSVEIDSVSAITSGAAARGVIAQGAGGVVINSTYVNISGDTLETGPTTNVRSLGIIGTSQTNSSFRNGDVLINSSLIEYSGGGTIGIYGASYDGDITINTDAIVSDGEPLFSDPATGGTGITYSPVAIATDSFTGNVTINNGTIINHGELGAGIASNRTTGLTTINTHLIETYGNGAMGITTGGVHGDVVITSDAITTRGDAIFVANLQGAYLGRDLFYADAIEAISLSGSVTVNSNDATVLGEGNQAITAIAATGATVNSRNATNAGEGVNAIGAVSDSGLVAANLTGATKAVNGTGVSLIGLNSTNVDVDLTADASVLARDGGVLIVMGNGSSLITNRGRIETTGTDLASATGAALDIKASAGASVEVNNSGTIIGGLSAQGVRGAAIDFSDADVNETLNLFTGSHIVGSVDAKGGVDTLNLEGTVDAVTTSQGFGDVLGFETINANAGYWVQSGVAEAETINVNAGALILTGTASGDAIIDSDAILQIGGGGTTGSLDGDITANGTLIFNRSDDYLFAGALAGAGSLIKRGAGLVTIDGVYSFTGTTSVQAGSLKISQLNADGALDLGAGGELDLSGGDQTVGGLNGDQGSSVNIDDGSLTISQEAGETSTFGGSLVGDGALTVDGGGVLNLTGINTYTGPTTVENGVLKVNGSISSAVTVNDGSVLGGAGTINGSILIRRNATIAPGNSPGVLNVVGPLTLASGSTYAVEVDPTQAITNDRIDASGMVTIESGALLAVAPQGSINLYQRVNEYTIINAAGGLVGTFAAGDISSSMALLTPRLVYSATALRMQLIRNDVRFNVLANSLNQFALATAAEATGDGTPIYNALIAQSDSGLRTGYDALSGEVYGGVGTFLIHEASGQREALLRHAAQGEANGYWIEALGQETTFDANAARGSAKARGSTTGFSAGGQVMLDSVVLGGSLSLANTDFDVGGHRSDVSIETMRGGVFAGAKAGFVMGRIGAEYAKSDMEASRSIVFPGVSQAAQADYSSTQLQVFGELALDSDLGPLDFEPFVGFAAIDTDIDGFQEAGPLGLTVADSSRYLTIASVGFRIAGPDSWLLKPRFDATFRHATGDIDGVVTSRFTGGANFDVLGANVDRDSAVLSGSLEYAIAPGMDLSAGYSGVFGKSTRQDLISASFNMRF